MSQEHRALYWPLLLAGLAVMTVLPIGVHTVMLDDLGVPYPSTFPHDGWASVPDLALIVFGAIYLDANLTGRTPQPFSAFRRVIFMFLAIAAMNQALLRLPIMRNVVSTRWTIYPFVDNLPAVLKFAAISMLVCVIRPLVTTITRRIAAAALIAVFCFQVIGPLLDSAFATIIAADAKREGDQLYTVPYDWHVDVPSYLTYLEPALGAFAVAMLLTGLRVRRVTVAMILFAIQGGPLFRLVLNIHYATSGPAMAVLSEAQFALEAAALAILAATISAALLRPVSVGKPSP